MHASGISLRAWLVAFSVLLPAPLAGQRARASLPAPLVFRHVTVIDGTGAVPRSDRTVIVKDGRIFSIARSADARMPVGAQVIEAGGRYLIPGLWDMHVHLAFENWKPFVAGVYLPLFIANGVTGVRDMAGDMPFLLDLRRQIAAGKILGPHLVMAGRELNGLPEDSGQIAVLHPAEARHAVQKLAAAGVDFIKVQDQISREVYFAIADEARRRRIPFAGHVPYSVTAAEASAAGQKSFEHLIGIPEGCSTKERQLKQAEADAMVRLDPQQQDAERALLRAFETYNDEKAAALFALLKRNHTWQVPTLVEERATHTIPGEHRLSDDRLRYMPEVTLAYWDTYMSDLTRGRSAEDYAAGKQFFEKELSLVRAMHRAGIRFLAGTDAIGEPNVFPGFSLHDELEMLVRAGFTPLEALQAATRDPAEYAGLLSSLGTVEPGKIADLVLLDANPLEDIRNTRRIAAVVRGGRIFPKESLQKMLAGAEALAGRTR